MTPARALVLAVFAFSSAYADQPKLGLSTGPATAPAARITVQMISAALGDDCLGEARRGAPAMKQKADMSEPAMAKRRCEQTSMQLSITSPSGGAAAELQVKKVELFDEGGKKLGDLTASAPSVWSDGGAYQPWDQKVPAGKQLTVTYPLSQPNWSAMPDRFNKTYLVKAVVSIAGADQAVQREVHVAAETILPPNVKT